MRCVPWRLTVEHKTKIKAICSDLSACFQAKGKTFLTWVVTEETWVHHYGAGTKRVSMECHHPQAPQKKKFESSHHQAWS
jgi:hypothetical protein